MDRFACDFTLEDEPKVFLAADGALYELSVNEARSLGYELLRMSADVEGAAIDRDRNGKCGVVSRLLRLCGTAPPARKQGAAPDRKKPPPGANRAAEVQGEDGYFSGRRSLSGTFARPRNREPLFPCGNLAPPTWPPRAAALGRQLHRPLF